MIWPALSDGFSIFIDTWPLVLAVVFVVCLGCSLSIFLLRDKTKDKVFAWQNIGALIFLFAISVILRLAFLTGTYVPPYFDSVEHYRIVKDLVAALESSTLLETLPSLTPGYYHLGFHLFASLLTFGLRANPINVILILGQVTLAAIPLPLFFLIRHETKNAAAAFFGTLLAGFGWYMPGFAVNWGKYPALSGLLAFEMVLCAAYFISNRRTKRFRFLATTALILSLLISTLFHSRTLIVILLSFVSWITASRLSRLSKGFQCLLLGALLAGILVLGIFIQREPLLNLALDPYIEDGILTTLVVVILSPFAFAKFPRGVYFSSLLILSVFVALFIPIGGLLPAFANQTLLDRPFVEMFLYLPLSILGALGLAGSLQMLDKIKTIPRQIYPYTRILTAIVFLAIAVLIPVKAYDFYPSDCCNFVKYDDTIAFDWLDSNLPPDANILIASTQMNVLPSGPSPGSVGTDAGIWIPALTGRSIIYAQFETDFRLPDTLGQLCGQQVDYVYIGSTEQSFKVEQLLERKEWYQTVLSLPEAQLFRVMGCFK